MRLPLLAALLAGTTPLAAQDDTTATAAPNDTVAVAEAAIERFLAGRDQNPTELWPQLVCMRTAGEERWCSPSPAGRVMPVLQDLAVALRLPIAAPGKVPPCGTAASPGGGRQLRIASLRITTDSAGVGVSLWCMGSRAVRMEGCRYHLVRQQESWVARPGAPVTCFRN